MINTYCYCLLTILLTACGHTYYVVRHAEKAAQAPNMTSDVVLTEAGEQRAIALRDSLKDRHIAYVFSTNTQRTRSTAKPTADQFHLLIQLYGPTPDSLFIARLRSFRKNVLVVGHSNTVDDIVNGLTRTKSIVSDLQDTEYDNLFVVKIRGKKIRFERRKYGVRP